jgi:hypothetical protein
MNVEQILGVALLFSGVFLLVSAVLIYLENFHFLKTVSASSIFLAEVVIGIFLVLFGLYLMKDYLQAKIKPQSRDFL